MPATLSYHLWRRTGGRGGRPGAKFPQHTGWPTRQHSGKTRVKPCSREVWYYPGRYYYSLSVGEIIQKWGRCTCESHADIFWGRKTQKNGSQNLLTSFLHSRTPRGGGFGTKRPPPDRPGRTRALVLRVLFTAVRPLCPRRRPLFSGALSWRVPAEPARPRGRTPRERGGRL